MKAIRIYQRGGPEVMQLEEAPIPAPKAGEVLIKVAAAGVNYSDIGQRNGNYPNLVPLPATLGNEVAGTVVAVGSDVTFPPMNSRVVALVEAGYAEYALARAEMVIPLPPEVSFAQATVIPIQGQTAYLLLDKAARLQKGERVLVHAAAGGVGSLAVQLAKLMGASMVIGTDIKSEKLDYLRRLGVDVAINASDKNWLEQVMQATRGQGVDVILEPVGGEIGQQSVMCLSPFGRMVVFGALTNQMTPFVAQMLIQKCLSVTGYNTVVQPPQDKRRASEALLSYIASGQLKITLDNTFSLAETAAAHQALERSETRGKVVLTL